MCRCAHVAGHGGQYNNPSGCAITCGCKSPHVGDRKPAPIFYPALSILELSLQSLNFTF